MKCAYCGVNLGRKYRKRKNFPYGKKSKGVVTNSCIKCRDFGDKLI